MLYQDAFEIVNPLGSRRKKHKYWQFMHDWNLLIAQRSTIENLILVLLAKEKYLKIFGQQPIFHQLMQDLKDLEINGVECFGKRIKCDIFLF